MLKRKLPSFLLYFMVFSVSGCLGSVKGLPDSSFQPSAETSLVFGSFELFNKEGQPFQLVPKSIRDIYSNLMIRSEEGKRYQIQISRKDGYFAAALPPGKYILVCFWAHAEEGRVSLACNRKNNKTEKITFVVLPSTATYIGSIHAFASVKERSKDNIKGRGGGDINPPPVSSNVGVQAADAGMELMKATVNLIGSTQSKQYLGFDSWIIKSDFEEARKIFTALYPNHAEPIERIAEIKSDVLNPK